MSQARSFPQSSEKHSEGSIPERLAFWARCSPGAPAVVASGRSPLTYLGLWRQVCEVTAALNAFGLGRGDRVALVLPNGPEMLAAFLGVSSGAVSAPLNSDYRAGEFELYFKDLQVSAMIVQSGHETAAREVAQDLDIAILELLPELNREAGVFTFRGAKHPSPSRVDWARPDDIALVLHTSGTTSRPKMVPLRQKNLCASALNIGKSLALGQMDRCLNVMPLFHIHGLIGGALSSLTAGGSVIAASGFETEQFFQFLRDNRPTWYTAVPTMHQSVLSYATENPEAVGGLSLRFIRSCSAPLPGKVMEGLEKVFQIPVIEAYGMTEAAHQIASNPLPPRPRKIGSVGIASGTEIAIMAEGGELLPLGETGEIVTRGDNLMAGYANNSDANHESFISGWFRTGDQGKMDQDGYLFITGRIKEIINRGGEKISPKEIDEVLLGHPAVTQAVTFAVPHDTLGEDIAAAVVLARGKSTTEAEIRQFAASRVTDFKVPSQIVIVDQIPKGPTGKLQRIGLAAILASKLKPEFVAPKDEIEKGLAVIWSHALDVKVIGRQDNFFALGGNSLVAARVFGRIETVYGRRLPLSTLFEAPTIERLASLLRAAKKPAVFSCIVPIQTKGNKHAFFCIHGPGGQGINYRNLALHFGDDISFFGVQARGLEDHQLPHTNIEEMAACYIKEIRAVQPKGPYFLGGFCFGGQIAFEMACQLQAEGESVALLALFESFVRRYPKSVSSGKSPHRQFQRFVRKIFFHFRTITTLQPKEAVAYLQRRMSNAAILIHLATLRLFSRLCGLLGQSLPKRLQLRDLTLIHYQAARTYVAKPYAGRVTLFLAKETPELSADDPRLGWSKLGAIVKIYELPCSHDDMLSEANVPFIAEKLRESIVKEDRVVEDVAGNPASR